MSSSANAETKAVSSTESAARVKASLVFSTRAASACSRSKSFSIGIVRRSSANALPIFIMACHSRVLRSFVTRPMR